ncbi:hypothetical protein B0H17DRAFT_1129835 [Mycena rosella]|uniref:Uncharacterized protein n=1 Tax=Mycena rosella TaxID=1033263 RepID=A0AAD7DUS5_MYCRO|nr:hypothetical protein B0H17DRAFT_1129835 [Mycena rosella]
MKPTQAQLLLAGGWRLKSQLDSHAAERSAKPYSLQSELRSPGIIFADSAPNATKCVAQSMSILSSGDDEMRNADEGRGRAQWERERCIGDLRPSASSLSFAPLCTAARNSAVPDPHQALAPRVHTPPTCSNGIPSGRANTRGLTHPSHACERCIPALTSIGIARMDRADLAAWETTSERARSARVELSNGASAM